MDFELTPEQQLVQQTAREFADRELLPKARDWDRAEELDRSIIAKLAELGFLAAALPEEHGGMGLDTLTYTLVVEEFGRGDSSVRGIVSVSNGLYGKTVAKWGNEHQRAALLPVLARGDALGCYALTEPGVGSDPASLEARAERDGDGWALSGQKIFITLGTWAKHALVFARTGEAGARGITCFVVPTDSAGFEARPIKGKLGLRAQDTAELFLDGVRVPDSARLGELGQGFKVAMTALDAGRISLGAGAVGIAQGCSSAGRSRSSSSCRSCSPISPSRPTRRACSSVARPRPRTRDATSASRRRSPSTTRARSPCVPRTPRSRSTAATGTSTSIPSASTFATHAC